MEFYKKKYLLNQNFFKKIKKENEKKIGYNRMNWELIKGCKRYENPIKKNKKRNWWVSKR